ncbi:hypothetical protein SAMN05444008_12422 [Cnuella takakiae]|uniref:Uncharacterized protein n=1 Tax=Cnuella takakiae TaxID=1302690 RepID=A0A1M5IJY5_9BACT|nr:hypothetical protein [Cnuella takakiae]OLY92212.1 hypothetical protein BUE76_10165 [Cnuella takakiae]SHG28587.1 hypothetical protein SAMN05444008_12422 [Cnuella takakiae]
MNEYALELHFSENLIWVFTAFVALVLLVLGAGILIMMRINRYKEEQRRQIRAQWKDLLAEMLMEENVGEQDLRLPPEFEAALQKPFVRRVLASELVRTQQSLRGNMNETITAVYNQLQLADQSLALLHSRKWHRKAKGIQQLSSMGQYQVAELIVDLTNHPNLSVRNEAQLGMIRLEGPDGLRFLNSLQHALSEWQQFNLLHQMQLYTGVELPDMDGWLLGSQQSVVVFAIRLCRLFQLFGYAGQIEGLQRHSNTAIRREANQCLHHWGLTELYTEEMLRKAMATPLAQPLTA